MHLQDNSAIKKQHRTTTKSKLAYRVCKQWWTLSNSHVQLYNTNYQFGYTGFCIEKNFMYLYFRFFKVVLMTALHSFVILSTNFMSTNLGKSNIFTQFEHYSFNLHSVISHLPIFSSIAHFIIYMFLHVILKWVRVHRYCTVYWAKGKNPERI